MKYLQSGPAATDLQLDNNNFQFQISNIQFPIYFCHCEHSEAIYPKAIIILK